MPDTNPAVKRERERLRRQRFTPAQKAAASEHSRLYMQHRRLTDEAYRTWVRTNTLRLYHKHREKRIATMRERQRISRLRCLQAYSAPPPFCGCCGETHLEFLTLDHLVDKRVDGGVRVGGDRQGQSLYTWLIRMNFPVGFRVLCFNCNCSRGTLGYCPHEVELDGAVERMVV